MIFSSELLKGTLKTIVLKQLADNKKMYGYEITQKVKELTEGKMQLTEGALYPTLHALEAELRKIRASCHAGGTTKDCAILQELSGTRARASRIESAATPRDRQRRSVASTRDGLGRSRCQR